MLLTITTTHSPATDLGYLLHKHPDKLQTVEIAAGKAHIFYPEVSEQKCTAALLLDIDPVGLVRSEGPRGNDFALEQYVNDRPYVASSFMSAAIAKAYSSALNGRCKDKPELPLVAMPFEVTMAVLPVKGGEGVLRMLFEPLGYEVTCIRHELDPAFPQWGNSRYFTVTLKHNLTLQQLLSHLYVLIPVCDTDKHYWVSKDEIEKLLTKGKDWLEAHPSKEMIVRRYLKNQRSLANQALSVLLSKDESEEESVTETEEVPDQVEEPKVKIHELRLLAAKEVLLQSGAKRVADLGCGEGRLIKLLLPEKQFEYILGMDVSYRSLEIAKERLKLERMPERQAQRIRLIQGSMTYRDKRLEGFDAAALVEVIEHLDEPRLAALEKSVFAYARPGTVVVTTPNAEYNVRFANYEEGKMRHTDHRFEWTRAQFADWGNRIAHEHGYTVTYQPVGEEDGEVGALSQMAVFTYTGHVADTVFKTLEA
ncbi:3' terminal RNA ribose 2'-O-methyltransferase Hen1 [Mucilaginibacter daejeonensis]|uniref:3' terminal RNA ribose 2'-O-methyltransferase Hen1 n=1 Tax=Mucilaginibacter daejeonensis TaxID=398049 RepID=UPI001D17A775|nr:3' terminal RNA ribose 2'-O-methyltransferase Hen1 [Mucilaginibacter daejeonensis]UEG54846.1 3' terminal RNA ribose 2'-O-methyltransferase Hen1 [Mucilaginibacter daejeonensis]